MLKEELLNRKAKLSPQRLALLEKLIDTKAGVEVQAIGPRTGDGPFPLSFSQQRLWFLDQLVPNSPAYNVVLALNLKEDIKRDIIHKSINEIVARHESLRTYFVSDNGKPYQVIMDELEVSLPVLDLTNQTEKEAYIEFKRCAQLEAKKPFDLSCGPLGRFLFIEMPGNKSILLLNLHHIVTDGWSCSIFVKELVENYFSLAAGKSSPFSELPVQYADFSMWQRKRMTGKFLTSQLDYWRAALDSEDSGLELPLDYTRAPVQDFQGDNIKFSISSELSDSLQRLGAKLDATLFMVLMTALKVVLHKYTGQREVFVGTPIANRNTDEIEELMGFFVNTVVLKTDLSGDPRFMDLVDIVKEVSNEAYAHQDIPFELLVSELQPEREMSKNPLFQVCFVYQNAPVHSDQLDQLLDSVEEIRNNTSKFDFWVQLMEVDGKLQGEVEYNSSIFKPSTIQRIVDSFQIVLESVAQNPELSVSNIPVMTEAEKSKILYDWNKTEVDYPEKDYCLHEIIEDQVKATPDGLALVCNDQKLTYQELNYKANQLANYLKELGVTPGSFVGIFVERSVEMVVGLVGILKAGAAYVPLDPSYRTERLEYMLLQSAPEILLVQNHLLEKLPENKSFLVCLDTEWSDIEKCDGKNFASGATKESITYLMYTSGSTGQPKGVLNTHKGLVNRLLWMQEKYQLNSDDRVLQKTPFSFDVSVWEFFWPLMTGAALVMARPDGHKDPYYFASIIYQEGVTTTHFVPSMLQVFLEDREVSKCKSLKRVICSGEALSLSVQERFHDRMQADLFNLYGPTEAAIDVTTWDCKKGLGLSHVPIGRPIANTQIYILDPHLNPVPVGVAGELHIGGIQLAKGYYKQDELTAEKFIPSPFSSDADVRLYKTGDLARFDENGVIEYVGRIDFQIKRRGVRIEPGEIESSLMQHELIREAVVQNRPFEHMPENKQLVAYIVPDINKLDNNESEELSQTGKWEEVFDKTYENEKVIEADRTLNVIGWDSSYTGLELPAEQMKLWVDSTNDRIRNLGVGKVLEIGCGTGLVVSGVAPYCQEYFATEISRVALAFVQERLIDADQELSHVKLFNTEANKFDKFDNERFDTVVLNSVIQYFPDKEYLNSVLDQAINQTADGGRVFIGDVRNMSMLEHFYACIELEKVSDTISAARFNGRVQKNLNLEYELTVNPEYFLAYQQKNVRITQVEIQLKRGGFSNEITQFRYDVVLHLDAPQQQESFPGMEWDSDQLDIESVTDILKNKNPGELGITGIPNSRVSFIDSLLVAVKALPNEDLGKLVERATSESESRGIDPEIWWNVADKTGYIADVSWMDSSQPGLYQVTFRDKSKNKIPTGWGKDVNVSIDIGQYISSPKVGKIARELTPVLGEYLKDKLPDYMIPSVFMVMKDLPIDSNGKLDRRSLPAPIYDVPEVEEGYAEAKTPVEKKLSEIWKQVLGIEQIDITKTFFELGGDSILTINVVTRAKRVNIKLTPQDIFQNKTIEKLALVVEIDDSKQTNIEQDYFQSMFGHSTVELVNRVKQKLPDAEDVYPLTVMQDYMLYRNLYTQESGVNLVHHLFSFVGKQFRPELMEQAWNRVLDYYPVLRTSFLWEGVSEPLQVVHKRAKLPFEVYDWRELTKLQVEDRLEQVIQTLRADGTDLKAAPHTKICLFRYDDDSYYYLHTFNLALQDGWSYHIIMKKLFYYYEMLLSGKEISAEKEPEGLYQKFVAWQLQQNSLRAEEFWKSELKDIKLPQPKLITSKNSQVNGQGRPYRQDSTNFSMEATQKLLNIAKKYHLTPYTIVQGMWALQLSIESHSDNVVFGSIYSGRGNPPFDVSETVGLFFNILPVVVRLSPNQSVIEYLESLQEKTHEISNHDFVPIRKIFEWSNVPRDQYLFETYLVNETFPDVDSTFNRYQDLVGATAEEFIHQTEHPLRLEIVFFNNELLMNVNYYRDYFPEGEVLKMTNRFLDLMEDFVSSPEVGISELRNRVSGHS